MENNENQSRTFAIDNLELFKIPGEGLQQNLAHKLVSPSQKDEERF